MHVLNVECTLFSDTTEQAGADPDVVAAAEHVQGDEVESPGAGTMPIPRLDRRVREAQLGPDVRRWQVRENALTPGMTRTTLSAETIRAVMKSQWTF